MPKHHPLRPIRLLVDEVLIELSPVFQRIYARTGRPSIPSERIIRALVLMMLFRPAGLWPSTTRRREFAAEDAIVNGKQENAAS